MYFSMRQEEQLLFDDDSLLVFGYGSLIWNPGFDYVDQYKAYARGFARRMYQGNTYHRGDDRLPGRVATLVENPSATANGVVFRVEGGQNIYEALQHLEEREVGNGYEFAMVPVDVLIDTEMVQMMALTCIAKTNNQFYLGPDNLSKMADEIRTARGCAGPNCEYVLKLAEHVRLLFPEDEDDHLFELEMRLRGARV